MPDRNCLLSSVVAQLFINAGTLSSSSVILSQPINLSLIVSNGRTILGVSTNVPIDFPNPFDIEISKIDRMTL